MRRARHHLKQGWILSWLLCAMVYATPSGAAAPHTLKDVWVLCQNGQWQVVLIVSGSIPYKAIEASDPLRLVLDLPNTSSKTMITSPVRENGVIGTVKTETVLLKPQPLTRVEISLNSVSGKAWYDVPKGGSPWFRGKPRSMKKRRTRRCCLSRGRLLRGNPSGRAKTRTSSFTGSPCWRARWRALSSCRSAS